MSPFLSPRLGFLGSVETSGSAVGQQAPGFYLHLRLRRRWNQGSGCNRNSGSLPPLSPEHLLILSPYPLALLPSVHPSGKDHLRVAKFLSLPESRKNNPTCIHQPFCLVESYFPRFLLSTGTSPVHASRLLPNSAFIIKVSLFSRTAKLPIRTVWHMYMFCCDFYSSLYVSYWSVLSLPLP